MARRKQQTRFVFPAWVREAVKPWLPVFMWRTCSLCGDSIRWEQMVRIKTYSFHTYRFCSKCAEHPVAGVKIIDRHQSKLFPH